MSDIFEDEPLTAAEAAAFRTLPRRMDPPAGLEDRTVAALRGGNLLGRRGPTVQPWWLAAAAAAVAFFAGGYAIGQARGSAQTVEMVVAVREADAAERAALVQQTGSAYVAALAALGELGATDAGQVGQGSEAAASALRAAIAELVRLRPDDARLVRALEILSDDPSADSTGVVRRVVWF